MRDGTPTSGPRLPATAGKPEGHEGIKAKKPTTQSAATRPTRQTRRGRCEEDVISHPFPQNHSPGLVRSCRSHLYPALRRTPHRARATLHQDGKLSWIKDEHTQALDQLKPTPRQGPGRAHWRSPESPGQQRSKSLSCNARSPGRVQHHTAAPRTSNAVAQSIN